MQKLSVNSIEEGHGLARSIDFSDRQKLGTAGQSMHIN